MVCGLLKKLCGMEEVEGEGSCNQTGHDYSKKFSEDLRAEDILSSLGHDVTVKKKIYWKCTKCGDLDREEKTIGGIKVKDGELEVV